MLKYLLSICLFIFTFNAYALEDGSFEAGFPNNFWILESSYGNIDSFPLCDINNCNFDIARTGDWVVLIGGVPTGVFSRIKQNIIIDIYDTDISLWIYRATCDSFTDTVNVKIDGDIIGSLACFASDLDYNNHLYSLDGYNDNNTHILEIEGTVGGTNGNHSNFFIDDISIISSNLIYSNGFE